MLLALTFVLAVDVCVVFDFVASNFPDEGTSVLDYFENVYISRPMRRADRHTALFPPNTWNVNDRVIVTLAYQSPHHKTRDSLHVWL
jgi:hypothetical protein